MNHKFKSGLNEMLKDEKKAPMSYSKLRKLASNKTEKRIISGIIRDERKHYGKLVKIKKRY